MAHLALTCPHCLTEKAGFSGDRYAKLRTAPGMSDLFHVFMVCGVCSKAVVVEMRGNGFDRWLLHGDPRSAEVVRVFPPLPTLAAPMHLPDNIRSFFLQGLDNHRRHHFDAAGTMFRKALDAALRRLHPDGKGTLQKRIEALPAELGVTPAMKAWAHEIRDLGNDAAHEDGPFTAEKSATLHVFTDLFLTYAFTLPAMLEARKANPQQEG